MVKVNRRLWAFFDILGMVLMGFGAFLITTMFPFPDVAPVFLAAGIMLIVAASSLIFLEGRKLSAEDKEFRRFEEIRDSARMVPNDLDECYLIDYTAEPEDAIFFMYDGTVPENKAQGIRSDEMIVYFQ